MTIIRMYDRKRIHSLEKGWTLIEILFVSLLISILSLVALSSYRENLATNQVVLAISELSGITQEIMMGLRNNTCIVSTRRNLTFLNHVEDVETGLQSIDISGKRRCFIMAKMKENLGAPIGGHKIYLFIQNMGSYYDIKCESSALYSYLPTTCHPSSKSR